MGRKLKDAEYERAAHKAWATRYKQQRDAAHNAIEHLADALKRVTYNYGHTIHDYEEALAESAVEFLKTGVFVLPVDPDDDDE